MSAVSAPSAEFVGNTVRRGALPALGPLQGDYPHRIFTLPVE
jgi:hypothetical protein